MSVSQTDQSCAPERTRALEWLARCCELLAPLGLISLASTALLLIALASGDAPLARFSYGGLVTTGVATLLCGNGILLMLAVMAQRRTPARHD